MENISNIETVQDLLKANEEKSPTETILKAIFEEEPKVGLEVVKAVLVELAQFHIDTSNNLSDEKDMNVVGWVKDATLLKAASELIDEVVLW